MHFFTRGNNKKLYRTNNIHEVNTVRINSAVPKYMGALPYIQRTARTRTVLLQ